MWQDPAEFFADADWQPALHAVPGLQAPLVLFTTVTLLAGPDGVLQYSSTRLLALVQSFVHHAKHAVGLNASVLGVDARGHTCRVLRRYGLPCVHSLPSFCFFARREGLSRPRAVDAKYYVASMLLRSGHSVLFSDVDVVFYRSPLPLLGTDHDLQGLSDRIGAGDGDVADATSCGLNYAYGRHVCQSTGLWFAAPTTAVVQLFDRFTVALQGSCSWEQAAFNRELSPDAVRSEVRYKLFPKAFFANFRTWQKSGWSGAWKLFE